MAKENDPLEGYRGRPERDSQEALEEEVRAFRSLASSDVNLGLLEDILKLDNILGDLNDETTTLKRLVTYASAVLGQSCVDWFTNDDPTSVKALVAHRNARTARLLMDWIDEQMRQGQQSEEIMMTEGTEDE